MCTYILNLSDIKRYLEWLEKTLFLAKSTIATHQHVLLSWFRSGVDHNKFIDESHTPIMRNKRIVVLHKFYSFLTPKGPNPIEYKLVRTARKLPKHVDAKTINEVVSAINGDDWISIRDRAIMELGISTMARISDFREMKTGDLDLFKSRIRVTGKGNKEAYLPLNPQAIAAMQRYLSVRKTTHDHLFVTKSGKPLKNVYPIMHKYLRDLINPHAFCRNSVAIAMAGKIAPNVLQKVMRHTSLSTTSKYIEIGDDLASHEYLQRHPRETNK